MSLTTKLVIQHIYERVIHMEQSPDFNHNTYNGHWCDGYIYALKRLKEYIEKEL